MRSKLVLLGLVALLAGLIGFVAFTPYQSLVIVKYGSYWLMLITFTLFVTMLVRSLRGAGTAWRDWRAYRWSALVVVACSVWLHVPEKHEFKIVMDEVVLSSTAMSLHYERTAATAYRGFEFMGNFDFFNSYVDKRPIFFPFLVSALHDLTGYRPANAFWLNALLTPVFLTLCLLVAKRLAGEMGGIATVLLVCTIPLVIQNACGGGFEFLNLVMIVLTLWLGMRYAEAPDSSRLAAFVLAGILLAQVRYESAIFILPVGVTILYVWWRQRAIDLPWPVLMAPLLLVNIPLHFNVFKVAEAAWQLGDIRGADHPFGVRYFYENIGHAFGFYLNTDGTQSNSILVSVLGLVGVGFFMLTFYRDHRAVFRDTPATAVFCMFIFGLLLHTLLMLCYFWGHFDDPLIRRLSLPSHLLLIFAFVFILPGLVKHPRRWHAVIGVTLAFFIACTVPISARHRYTQENFAARTNNWLFDYIQRQSGRHILAIDDNSALQWVLHEQSAVTAVALSKRPEAYFFHFKNHTFDDYLAVQKTGVDFETGRHFVAVGEDLGDGFTLELIAEYQLSPVYFVRLSRVVAVDEEKAEAWAKKRLTAVPVSDAVKNSIQRDERGFLEHWLRMLP